MYKLEIDNDKQEIQGIKFIDRKLFCDTRTIVEAENLEGWKPTQEDILKLLKGAKISNLNSKIKIN